MHIMGRDPGSWWKQRGFGDIHMQQNHRARVTVCKSSTVKAVHYVRRQNTEAGYSVHGEGSDMCLVGCTSEKCPRGDG